MIDPNNIKAKYNNMNKIQRFSIKSLVFILCFALFIFLFGNLIKINALYYMSKYTFHFSNINNCQKQNNKNRMCSFFYSNESNQGYKIRNYYPVIIVNKHNIKKHKNLQLANYSKHKKILSNHIPKSIKNNVKQQLKMACNQAEQSAKQSTHIISQAILSKKDKKIQKMFEQVKKLNKSDFKDVSIQIKNKKGIKTKQIPESYLKHSKTLINPKPLVFITFSPNIKKVFKSFLYSFDFIGGQYHFYPTYTYQCHTQKWHNLSSSFHNIAYKINQKHSKKQIKQYIKHKLNYIVDIKQYQYGWKLKNGQKPVKNMFNQF